MAPPEKRPPWSPWGDRFADQPFFQFPIDCWPTLKKMGFEGIEQKVVTVFVGHARPGRLNRVFVSMDRLEFLSDAARGTVYRTVEKLKTKGVTVTSEANHKSRIPRSYDIRGFVDNFWEIYQTVHQALPEDGDGF